MFEIDISNLQNQMSIPASEVRSALEAALRLESVSSAILSVTIVDNAAIQQMNREYLQHDYPTDVISFQLDFTPGKRSESTELSADSLELLDVVPEFCRVAESEMPGTAREPLSELRAAGASIEGEIIVSAEMAVQLAKVGQWSPLEELKLYVIHGMLHLCGYDDTTPDEQGIMRSRERVIMADLGFQAVYADDSADLPAPERPTVALPTPHSSQCDKHPGRTQR